MPEWCAKCNAMLAPGLESCPVCGARLGLKASSQPGGRDILWFSATILAIALVPLLIALAIGVICMLTSR